MARSAAAAHLELAYSRMDFKPALTETVIDTLNRVRDSVIELLWNLNTKVARKTGDVNSYIERKRLKQADVEANIRDHRLREALRTKQELEQKLQQVSQSIQKLGGTSDDLHYPQKADLRDSRVRKQFFSEESARVQEATELAQRLRKEQIEVIRRQRERQREQEEKLKSMDLEAQKVKKDEDHRKQEEKERQMFEIKEKIRKRKEAMEAKRRQEAEEMERLKEQKYAEQKLLQDFHKRVMLPIEEQRAEVITKTKALHKPISKEELEEHARKHDEEMRLLRAQHEAERREKIPEPLVTRTSKFTQSILMQARRETEDREVQESEKRALQEKRKRYAALVKSLFVPEIDVMKQKELELMKERLKTHPVTARAEIRAESSPAPFKPRKFKPNSMVPPAREKKIPSASDYLAEQRKLRDNYEKDKLEEDKPVAAEWTKELLLQDNLSPAEKAKFIQHKALKLEQAARRKELLLSHVNPANPKALELGEKTDEAVIETIKAKLSVIEGSQL